MTDYDALIQRYQRLFARALDRLEISHAKVKPLPTAWESFVARFGRASDMFLSRLLRALISRSDPGFSGSLRDYLNQGEKLGFIDDAHVWLEIRELRNLGAHAYAEEALGAIFEKTRLLAPHLLALRTRFGASP